MLDSLPGVYYMYGEDLALKRWNRNFETVTGYSGAELQSMSPLEFFRGEDRERVSQRIQEVFRSGFADVEADFVSREGTHTPFYFTGSRTRIGGKSYLLGVGIDLTELRQTQQRLIASERRLREIFEAANVGIGVAGPDDRLLEVNQGFCDIVGYSRAELIGMGTYELVHPDDVAESRRISQAVHQGQTDANRGERRYLRKDGSQIWVNVFSRFLTDAAGHEIYSVGVIMDVTERHRAEAALRNSEHRYQLANRATFNAIWDWDFATDGLFWNETFYTLFRYREAEVEPCIESWTRSIHPDDRARVSSGIHAAIDSGQETWHDEYRFLRGDGSYADVEDRGYIAHGQDGRPLRMIGAIQDITDRKRAAAELLRKEEHLRLALDAAQMATFDWDMVSGEMTWRHTSSDWLGTVPGTIHDKAERFLAMVHDADRAAMQEKIAQCIATRSNYSHESRLVWPDGSVHWVLSLANFDFDAAGTALRMRGVLTETTARRQAEEELKLFRTLVDRANDAIEVIDPESGRFLDVNDTFCRTLGYTREEVLSLTVSDLDPSFDAATWRTRATALREAGVLTADGWHRCRDGRTYPVEISMAWVRLDRDFIVASVRDISERRQAERNIRRLSRIQAVLSGINQLIVRERDRGRLLTGACRIAVEKGEFACAWVGTLAADGACITPVAVAETDPDFRLPAVRIPMRAGALPDGDILLSAMNTGRPQVAENLNTDAATHLSMLGMQGRGYLAGIALPLLTHGRTHGELVLYTVEQRDFDAAELDLLTELAGDISFALEYMETQEQIRHMAFHDSLTGLANRAYLMSRLTDTLAHARAKEHACGLLLMNLNDFQSVNNSLGHANGDLLLRQVADRLRRIVWSNDVVACLGADEFAILLPRLASADDVDIVIQKLNTGLRDPFTIGDLPLSVELRTGYALFPAHADNAEKLWQRASVALHAAKQRHRAALQYDPAIDQFDPENLALLGGLRAAIDGKQLLLHYQPKIDLHTMAVTGVEALVRWQHPHKGLIFPDRFIPLAEQTMLIAPLSRAILSTAMTQAAAWQQQGLDLNLAVNLSARNIHDPLLFQDIVELASRADFPVRKLILEITESAIMADPEQGRAMLAQLSGAGIGISMDDFGIGQSSLASLKDLPIDQVKIDKSFVMGIREPRNAAVVRGAIELAQQLGMKVTAEGIEDAAALAQLREWNCDTGQGYYFSKPLPSESFGEWLAKWRRK